MEVRQRPRPTHTQYFDTRDLTSYLDAFGDDTPSLPETVRILDTIAVDYIIETCYSAESHARLSGRQKVKMEDFQWALRGDSRKLGRVAEMLEKDRVLRKKRKAFEMPEEGVKTRKGRGRRGKSEEREPEPGEAGKAEGKRKKRKYTRRKGREGEGGGEKVGKETEVDGEGEEDGEE